MIEIILIVAGLTGMVEALFEKWGVFGKISELGSKSNRLVYELSQCRFCLRFWISVVVTGLVLTVWPFSWPVLIVPFVVGGLIWLTLRT